jgi:hypothetical protein
VHHAYSKRAEVTVPSLDDWEKDWQENPQRGGRPKMLLVDFYSKNRPQSVIRRSRLGSGAANREG